ncbi:Class V chitinase [Cardamine amara subsp. amara]|uniref:Class V chitinase n=1 Tax=Cardamine amara subsp. amara TaxID=228776 RepID=A0ABD1AEM3_CARAN
MTDSETHGSSAGVVKASYWYPDGETPTTAGVSLPSSAIWIDSTLFTHLFCAIVDLEPHTHKVVIPFKHKYEFSTFTEIVQKKNPDVETLLSIGGKKADNSVLVELRDKTKKLNDPLLR